MCVVLAVDVAILRRQGFAATLMYATCCVHLATVLRYVGSIERYKSAYQMRFFLIYSKDSVEDTSLDIEVQEQKFRQLLDQLIYSTTQLTNTLVSNVVESSPQLYVKTKLQLLSCIGSLSQAVVKLQQNWNELTLYRKTARLASTEEESIMFLAKEKKKRSKRVAQSAITSTKRGRKKAMAEPASIPVEMSILFQERIHDEAPPPSPQTLHKEKAL